MKLTLAKALARKWYQEVVQYLTLLAVILSSADNLCKQFEPKSGPTTLFDWKKSSIQRVKYGTIIKCEEIIKAILGNPKADQYALFADM